MARIFTGVPTVPYIGTPFSQPITMCEPSVLPPVSIPFTIDWITYGAGAAKPNVGVGINLGNAGGNKTIIDVIRGVYIDNLANDVPVYVTFPGTEFTVAAQPNAAVFFPVFTQSLQAVIVGEGFTQANRDTRTKVFFTNVNVPPYVDNEQPQVVSLYRASPAIQRGGLYNSLFAPPALGDQTVQVGGNPAAPFVVSVLPQQASGFYYITGVALIAIGLANNPALTIECFFSSLGDGGSTLYDFPIFVPTVWNSSNQLLFNQTGLQLKIEATREWVFRNFGNLAQSGSLQFVLNYTYQP